MTEYEIRVERTCYKKSMFNYKASLIKRFLEDGYTISDISKITNISEKGVDLADLIQNKKNAG